MTKKSTLSIQHSIHNKSISKQPVPKQPVNNMSNTVFTVKII